MDTSKLERLDETRWRIPATGSMQVPAVIFADRDLIEDMDDKVHEQICNVCRLPGIVKSALVMPDAHWGYGFPIGGVAAFAADEGGVISAGGVGFDISCGVRLIDTGVSREAIQSVQAELAHELSRSTPAGVGSTGRIRLDDTDMDNMLTGGAKWAVAEGYGLPDDLEHIEESGCQADPDPAAVSARARRRQRNEMGTLGSGNHYLEVQYVSEVFNNSIADAYGLREGDAVISIHCGSRGLGHQIGTEFLREMAISAEKYGIKLPDRELACAPINSGLGQRYLGAMRAAVNCALANRQILTHLTRTAFAQFFPDTTLKLVYDVSHNICKEEHHVVDGESLRLHVHRKGATRALGPGSKDVPAAFRNVGQPVFIGGSMGTSSYVLAGTEAGEELAFSSACHGAGRKMSRHQARKRWRGREIADELAQDGVIVRSPSSRGIAEEAPGAYKDVTGVVDAADRAGLTTKVCRLRPMICIKG
ncbi:MAG: RtcB family protein [Gammaproteobacteria bacterium]|nr:RtcB family protein [Gammaproteobacteria bacterium]